MRFVKKIAIFMLFCLLCLTNVGLKATTKVYASSYILMESSSKRVLTGENINNKYLTASICKILTAIIVIENTDIDGYVLVDKETVNQTGSAIYMEENDLIKVRDLLYGLMLRSGNDCAYLLARYSYGNVETFVNVMNQYASKIGMHNSSFGNPSGLDEYTQNYSTAYDMAILMIYAMNNPVFKEIVNTKKHVFTSSDGKHYYLYNKHKLVNAYDYIIGGKTGYTILSKRTLVSYASKNGMDLVCVTFNCGDDWNAHLHLFEYGYDKYQMTRIMDEQIIRTKKEYKITPYLKENILLPITEYEKKQINIKIFLLNDYNVNVDDALGKVVININDEFSISKFLYPYYNK